jgi:hypothetical protein
VLILIGMWWFLSFSSFCHLRVWLCAVESLSLSDSLPFLLLWFGTAYPLMVLFAFIFCVQNFLVCWSGLLLCFVFFCYSLFWGFPYHGSLTLQYCLVSSLIHLSLFIVFSVSLWCLFRSPVSSFICLCVFLYSLFLVSWNSLSASCTFWLTVL